MENKLKNKFKIAGWIIGTTLLVLWGMWFFSPPETDISLGGRSGGGGESGISFSYVTEGSNQILANYPITLERVIITSEVTNGDMAIYNASAAGADDSDMVLYLQADGTSMQRTYEIGTELDTGLLVNVTEDSGTLFRATIIYSPK